MERTLTFCAAATVVAGAFAAPKAQPAQKPNVIILMADDLGYGDLGCYGATLVKTPNADRVAREGVRFTQCHAAASTSTPSRYGLLTGEYPWRRPGTGVAAGNAAAIITPDRYTMADMFQQAGYKTGAFGKWHLGLGSVTGQQDWNGRLDHTPRDIGFDYHYIQAATADRVPCVYLEQDTVANYDPTAPIEVSYKANFDGEPTGAKNPEKLKLMYSHGHDMSIVDSISRIGFMRGGGKALWRDENIADSIVAKARKFINENAGEPFFMYLCTNDVHVPRWPHERFRGNNAMGLRGDAIASFDWTVGEVLKALDEAGVADNTLLIITSDNGPVLDDGYVDRAVELVGTHQPTGGRRGDKYSVYEGGSMVPMIVRWPAGIKPHADTDDSLMSHIDLFRSLAKVAGGTIPAGAAPDSREMSKQLLGNGGEADWIAEQSTYNTVSVRTPDWKYIPSTPRKGPIGWEAIGHEGKMIDSGERLEEQLFNIATDPKETTNIADKDKKQLERMKKLHAKVTKQSK